MREIGTDDAGVPSSRPGVFSRQDATLCSRPVLFHQFISLRQISLLVLYCFLFYNLWRFLSTFSLAEFLKMMWGGQIWG